MNLNLGAGGRILPGWVNVDRVAGPGIDLVHDLDQLPWPIEDGSVLDIQARDVFEHVNDPIGFMTECYRVLVPGGQLWIRTPCISLSLSDAFTDPTHRRFPTWHTFDYWVAGTPFHAAHNAAYGGVTYQLENRRNDAGSMVVILAKPV